MVNAIQQSQLAGNTKDDDRNSSQQPTSFDAIPNSSTNGFHQPSKNSKAHPIALSSSASGFAVTEAHQPDLIANAVCEQMRQIDEDEDENFNNTCPSRILLMPQSTMSEEHVSDGCPSELVTSSTSSVLAAAGSQLPLMTEHNNHINVNHHNGSGGLEHCEDDDEEEDETSSNHNSENRSALNSANSVASSLQVNEINCTVTISDDSNSVDAPLEEGPSSQQLNINATTINNNKQQLVTTKIEQNCNEPTANLSCSETTYINNVQKLKEVLPHNAADDDDDVIEIQENPNEMWQPTDRTVERPAVIVDNAVAERNNHQNQVNHQVESQLKSFNRIGNNSRYGNHHDSSSVNCIVDNDGGGSGGVGFDGDENMGASGSGTAADPCCSSDLMPNTINSNSSNSNSSSLSLESSGESDEVQETRRVEPLKINLSREPIKTVIKLQPHHHLHHSDDVKSSGPHSPKITIKPINRPDTNISPSSQSSQKTISSNTAADHPAIPKLTIKPVIKHTNLEPSEDHEIVPKLTIKSNNEGEGAHIVPKLTIRSSTSSTLSNPAESSKKEAHVIVNNNSGTSHILEDGVKLTIKPVAEPPLPKLTIKTTGDCNDATFIVNTKEPASPITKLNIKPIVKPDSPVHPKVTIKPIIKPPDEEDHPTVPKLTIKSKRCDSPVPKIVVRVPKDSTATLSTPSSSGASNDESECSVEEEAIPKLTIRQVKSTTTEDEQIVIPKVTIKPIVNPNDANADSETLITPKITIKPIPKPLDITQPLEIVTPVHRMETNQPCQSSPRIIIKINKNKETDDLLAETVKPSAAQQFDSELKRTRNRNDPSSSHEVESKKMKLMSEIIEIDDEDSQTPQRKEKTVPPERSNISATYESKNRLKLILKRMHLDNNAKAELEATHSVTITNMPKIEEKRPPTRQSRRNAAKAATVSVPEETDINDGPSNANMPYFPNDSNDAMSIPEIPHLIVLNEGSSSDCIIVEDGGSDPLNMEDSSDLKLVNNDHSKKEQEASVDRDSGVDVCHSGKQVGADVDDAQEFDSQMTPAKRPRGRPRKETLIPRSTTKKQSADEAEPKRKFAGITMASAPQNDAMTFSESVESNGNEATLEVISLHDADTSIDEDGIVTVTVDDEKESNSAVLEPLEKKEDKKRAPRIIPDDDDESPTFNPLNRSLTPRRGRGRGYRGRGSKGRGSKQVARVLLSQKILANSQTNMSLTETPERYPNGALFSTPDGKDRRKLIFKDTPSSSMSSAIQLFEEDTRMSADLTNSVRNPELYQNEESQSSVLSCTSATVESNSQKRRCKMEVVDPEGRAEYTVDMITEYDWPPPKGCCPSRNRDTYMIQEQVCEYLGVKSFKRRYPELQRRMVEMEERNYLQERGQVSEKMCDMGLTAVLASDVLDIMVNDFYDKFEEYKRFRQDKHIRDLASRQKNMRQEMAEKSVYARENAIDAAVAWNSQFNKSRKEDRRQCLDLQNLVINLPEDRRKKMSRPTPPPTHYPIALVPGQFQEYYRRYTPAELLCYPINTVLSNPVQLRERLRQLCTRGDSSDSDSESSDSSSESSNSGSSSSSSSDSDSSSSESEEEASPQNSRCRVCDRTQNSNQNGKPELYIKCSSCRRKAHPSCIEISPRMATRVREYSWQCSECKQCVKCRRETDEDKMLFCDQCDRGYHIYCIGLTKVPEDRWNCSICSICTNCGTRSPEGNMPTNQKPTDANSAAKLWTHEYRSGKVREHIAMLCVPCARLKNGP